MGSTVSLASIVCFEQLYANIFRFFTLSNLSNLNTPLAGAAEDSESIGQTVSELELRRNQGSGATLQQLVQRTCSDRV